MVKRGRENLTSSNAHTFHHMYIHKCIQIINPEKMRGTMSAAENSGVDTLGGHKCHGYTQHIHARVHLAFHFIEHSDTHKPSVSSGPH